MSKLTDAAFAKYLEEARHKIGAIADDIQEKPINYGHQFSVFQGQRKVTVNVYNGKKGLNVVYTGEEALKEKLAAALEGRAVSEAKQAACGATCADFPHEYEPVYEAQGQWAGSDESGKGDFFGPLVVAAVVVDNSTAAKLRAAGVKDCKLLSDKKILELEDVIKVNVVDYAVLELKPEFYNLRYEQVVAAGGKLNQLLGSGHINALSQVLQRQPNCHSALIDQFTTSTVNLQVLRERFPQVKVSQMPKAESNLAVAAASVLARARFLQTMRQLGSEVGLAELPKGGGGAVTACARQLVDKLGKAALRKYVKLHFQNYQKI